MMHERTAIELLFKVVHLRLTKWGHTALVTGHVPATIGVIGIQTHTEI